MEPETIHREYFHGFIYKNVNYRKILTNRELLDNKENNYININYIFIKLEPQHSNK